MTKFFRRRTLMALVILQCGWGLVRCSADRGSRYSVVKRSTIIQKVAVSGFISPNRKTVVAPPYSGYVQRIYVNVGDRVKAGSPIISINQSLIDAKDRAFPLLSPFAGVVVQVMSAEGEYVDPSNAKGNSGLVRIDDLSQLYVDADVPEVEVRKLKIGQLADIQSVSSKLRHYHGQVQRIALAAKDYGTDSSVVQFPTRFKVLDPDDGLYPGMSVIVEVVTQKLEGVLSLEPEYVERQNAKHFARAKNGEKIPIEIGVQDDEHVQIVSGLKEGQEVLSIDR